MIDKQQLAAMGEHMREAEECKPNFKVPYGWMFAYTGDAGDEVLLTAIFTNTEDADVTRRDVYP